MVGCTGGLGGGGGGGGGGIRHKPSANQCTNCGKTGASSKPINLPSYKKINIDMVHIKSGHMKGGSRVSNKKTVFPEHMNNEHVRKAILDAYKNCKKMGTQGDRVRVRGESRDGTRIEMWVNTKTNTIETAYPIP